MTDMKNKKLNTGKQPKQNKLTNRNILIILICIMVSAIAGACSGDIIIGGSMLAVSLVGSYLAALQKRYNYILGFINAILLGYIGFKNGLYGSFFSNIFLFAPLELHGFIIWSHNLNYDKNVKIRKLNRKESIIVVSACTIGSFILGYLLTKIPTQQMAFLDATICCIDICAIIIMNFRYRESWWLWIISGVLSIVVWATALINGGPNAFMRLLAATGFLIINTYGAIKWNTKLKTVKH